MRPSLEEYFVRYNLYIYSIYKLSFHLFFFCFITFNDNGYYILSSYGVFTKYVINVPFPFTKIGPRHSQAYPAAIRIFDVFSVVLKIKLFFLIKKKMVDDIKNIINTCRRPITPQLSILLATLTVLLQISYWGFCAI